MTPWLHFHAVLVFVHFSFQPATSVLFWGSQSLAQLGVASFSVQPGGRSVPVEHRSLRQPTLVLEYLILRTTLEWLLFEA